MDTLPERASQRNNFHIIPLSRPRIERERDAEGWLVLLPGAHGWLVGDRRQALREFAGLVEPVAWQRCDIVNKAEQQSLRTILDQWGAP